MSQFWERSAKHCCFQMQGAKSIKLWENVKEQTWKRNAIINMLSFVTCHQLSVNRVKRYLKKKKNLQSIPEHIQWCKKHSTLWLSSKDFALFNAGKQFCTWSIPNWNILYPDIALCGCIYTIMLTNLSTSCFWELIFKKGTPAELYLLAIKHDMHNNEKGVWHDLKKMRQRVQE